MGVGTRSRDRVASPYVTNNEARLYLRHPGQRWAPRIRRASSRNLLHSSRTSLVISTPSNHVRHGPLICGSSSSISRPRRDDNGASLRKSSGGQYPPRISANILHNRGCDTHHPSGGHFPHVIGDASYLEDESHAGPQASQCFVYPHVCALEPSESNDLDSLI